MSQNEWTTTEIRGLKKLGRVSPLSCPGAALCAKKKLDELSALEKARKDLVAAKTRKSTVDADLADARAKLDEEKAKAAAAAAPAAAAAAAEDAPPPKDEGDEKDKAPPAAPTESVVEVRVNALTDKALQAAVAECAALQDVETAQGRAKACDAAFFVYRSEDCASLRSAEDAMVARDEGVKAVSEKRNALETKVLELRSAKNGKHYKLFEEKNADFGALLDAHEEWLWGDEAAAATADAMEAKLQTLDAEAKAMVPAYFAIVEEERVAMEKQLEEEAKAAAAQSALDGDDDEQREDRLNADTRKLKFGDRMRLVEKNKNEGTELFKGGNWTHAAKRYKDALGHAAKFRDLNPDQTAASTKIKVDCHVNMALCWTKLDNVDQALKSAEEALKLAPDHPKAMYRRAAAFEKLAKFDEAKKDLNVLLKANPEDKPSLALAKRVDAQLARQKAKTKKMAAKMFA